METSFETSFDFQDLSIPLLGKTFEGMLLSGTATLSGDQDGFDVTHIALDDGPDLRKGGNGLLGLPAAFEDEFFKRIAAVIENEKTPIGRRAEATWNELIEEAGTVPCEPEYSTINKAQTGIVSGVASFR